MNLIVFSLVCSECDAGDDIRSREQAEAQGWTRIEESLDLPMANYIGVCPDCREEYER